MDTKLEKDDVLLAAWITTIAESSYIFAAHNNPLIKKHGEPSIRTVNGHSQLNNYPFFLMLI